VSPVSRRLTTAVSLAHPRSARVRRHHPVGPVDPVSPVITAGPAQRVNTPGPAAVTVEARDLAMEPGVLRCGDLVLDESRWTVHRAGTLVDLSPTEFRLLACLLRHQGRVLTRAELLESVWGRGYTGQSQVVETYVSYLRRKLDRLGPPLIHTRRGVGYALRRPEPGGPGQGDADRAAD
jgi:DNA-binding response OmpR family regulator